MECARGKILDQATIRNIFAAKKNDLVFTTSILVSHSNKPLLNERKLVALLWGSFHLFVHEFCRPDGDPL
jgi:hypothetical protein